MFGDRQIRIIQVRVLRLSLFGKAVIKHKMWKILLLKLTGCKNNFQQEGMFSPCSSLTMKSCFINRIEASVSFDSEIG